MINSQIMNALWESLNPLLENYNFQPLLWPRVAHFTSLVWCNNWCQISPSLFKYYKSYEKWFTWQNFLKNYNGVTIISKTDIYNSTDLHLFSDSSKISFGGVYGREYIYGPFPESWQQYDIQFLELYPILLLVDIFKASFVNKSIIFHCDNISVVYAINKQTSRNKLVMTIIRKLVLIFLPTPPIMLINI